MIDKKNKTSPILILLLLIFLVLLFTSCSSNYHLKQSKKHYDKAISKGYEPKQDTLKTISSIKPIPLNISDNKRTLTVNLIDTILIRNNVLDSVIRYKIRKELITVVDTVIKYIEIDTVLTLQSGGKAHLKIENGAVSLDVENVQVKDWIYIERMPYWMRVVGAIMIMILILFVFLFVVRTFFR